MNSSRDRPSSQHHPPRPGPAVRGTAQPHPHPFLTLLADLAADAALCPQTAYACSRRLVAQRCGTTRTAGQPPRGGLARLRARRLRHQRPPYSYSTSRFARTERGMWVGGSGAEAGSMPELHGLHAPHYRTCAYSHPNPVAPARLIVSAMAWRYTSNASSGSKRNPTKHEKAAMQFLSCVVCQKQLIRSIIRVQNVLFRIIGRSSWVAQRPNAQIDARLQPYSPSPLCNHHIPSHPSRILAHDRSSSLPRNHHSSGCEWLWQRSAALAVAAFRPLFDNVVLLGRSLAGLESVLAPFDTIVANVPAGPSLVQLCAHAISSETRPPARPNRIPGLDVS